MFVYLFDFSLIAYPINRFRQVGCDSPWHELFLEPFSAISHYLDFHPLYPVTTLI